MCLNCQPPPLPLLTDKPRQRAGGSYVQSRVMLRGSVRTGGWVGRGREEGVARMLDRSRICIAPLKTARAMAFACRKTHASLRLVLRPLCAPVLSLGARRPYPTPPARRAAVTPPRPSAVVPHQPLVAKWLNLRPRDAGSSIPRLCQWPEEMRSYP